jgi:acetylglutamate synthase
MPLIKGHGLADLLWDEIKKDYKGLFWRSKSSNPINSWYFRRAQGSWSTNNWILFWYGINDPLISSELIKYSLDLEISFKEDNAITRKSEAILI